MLGPGQTLQNPVGIDGLRRRNAGGRARRGHAFFHPEEASAPAAETTGFETPRMRPAEGCVRPGGPGGGLAEALPGGALSGNE